MKKLFLTLLIATTVISACNNGSDRDDLINQQREELNIIKLGNVSFFEKGEFITFKFDNKNFLAVSLGKVTHPLIDVEVKVQETNNEAKIILNSIHESYIDEGPFPNEILFFSIDTNKKINIEIKEQKSE